MQVEQRNSKYHLAQQEHINTTHSTDYERTIYRQRRHVRVVDVIFFTIIYYFTLFYFIVQDVNILHR